MAKVGSGPAGQEVAFLSSACSPCLLQRSPGLLARLCQGLPANCLSCTEPAGQLARLLHCSHAGDAASD